MLRIVIVFLAIAASVTANGCGRVLTVLRYNSLPTEEERTPPPYGGLCLDLQILAYLPREVVAGEHTEGVIGAGELILWGCLWMVDLPFTAIVDTLALPGALSAMQQRAAKGLPGMSPWLPMTSDPQDLSATLGTPSEQPPPPQN
jgi:uncharacterized protein YceK